MERSDLLRAAVNCPHTITDKSIVLEFNPDKPGHNALNQLGNRLEAAAAVQPDIAEALAAILFPNGRASVSEFQRLHRMQWDAARQVLQELQRTGWLVGLELSPHLKEEPTHGG